MKANIHNPVLSKNCYTKANIVFTFLEIYDSISVNLCFNVLIIKTSLDNIVIIERMILMKKIYLWFFKAIVSVVVSFCIISVFCFFYCNYPIRLSSQTNSTDYYWQKNDLSIRGTEGFAYSKVDENGFVNTFANNIAEIDILLMGSSHTEGFNVCEKQNYAYLLNELFKNSGYDMCAYNIGISGHTTARCFNNLENAIKEFKPNDYVVVEATDLEIPLSDLKSLDSGTFEVLTSYDSGVIYTLQKSDFLRQVYSQMSNALKQNNTNADTDVKSELGEAANAIDDELEEYSLLLEKTIKKVSEISKKYDCQLIINYIPGLDFDYEGNVLDLQMDVKDELFVSLCEKYDIKLVNMYSSFVDVYNDTYHLPRGFSNTSVGEGHTNKYGHSAIANEIYRCITEDIEQ